MRAKISHWFSVMKFSVRYRIVACTLLLIIVTEVILRVAFGLENPVLLQADADTGYRFRPNQIVFRFGKKIQYNQYSQRSEPINIHKPPGTLRILMVGDSVLNGGNPTDQKETISELFKTRLKAKIRPIEVLNASAGSWGIGNELGYIRKFGTFESDAIILELSTHDLTQPTSTNERLVNDPNYPTHPPLLALQEAWNRYALPKLFSIFHINSLPVEVPPSPLDPEQQFQQNMQELEVLTILVRTKNIPFFVIFIPQFDNVLSANNTPKYKFEFLKLCKKIQIPVIDIQTNWSNLPQATVKTYYRDNFHPDVPGNQSAADLLFDQLCIASKLPACSSNSRQ